VTVALSLLFDPLGRREDIQNPLSWLGPGTPILPIQGCGQHSSRGGADPTQSVQAPPLSLCDSPWPEPPLRSWAVTPPWKVGEIHRGGVFAEH
jgi:hypothetical protein